MQPSKFLLHDRQLDKELYERLYTFNPNKEVEEYTQPLRIQSKEIEN